MSECLSLAFKLPGAQCYLSHVSPIHPPLLLSCTTRLDRLGRLGLDRPSHCASLSSRSRFRSNSLHLLDLGRFGFGLLGPRIPCRRHVVPLCHYFSFPFPSLLAVFTQGRQQKRKRSCPYPPFRLNSAGSRKDAE